MNGLPQPRRINRSLLRLTLLGVLSTLLPAPLHGQQQCQPPSLPLQNSGANIFSEEQEMHLGDAIAEHLQRSYRIIDDEALTGYLQRIGARIIANLPASRLRFQFFLVDLNDVNAFTLPGGRIYLTRKMVGFTRNEDELAGVIGHELGHIVAHHATIDMTFLLKEVLGVTQVGDRRDIFEKYNQMIENAARRPGAFEKIARHSGGEQDAADLIGLYAMTRAGYDPQAQVSLWDRYNETKGKTGNFFSDLFGTTKPAQKRLGEMIKGLASLPAECKKGRLASTEAEFDRWRAAVINYAGSNRAESLPGLMSRIALTPALRSEINHLRFSPDGKYLLAQDDSGITVLTRQPFVPLFRINSRDAASAQFSLDSREIFFHTSKLRVEEWDLGQQKMKTAHELVVRKGCLQTALSANGKILACLDGNFDLDLLDVVTGNQVLQKKSFYKPSIFDALTLLVSSILDPEGLRSFQSNLVRMSFSPDARYFVAGDRSFTPSVTGGFVNVTTAVAFDTSSQTNVPLGGDLKEWIAGGFAFVGSDKIVGVNWDKKKAALVKFPEGTVTRSLDFLNGSLKAVTEGDYVLLQPQGKLAAVLELETQKLLLVPNQAALDVYKGMMASERRNGELALYNLKATVPPEAVTLPQSPLGRLYAADVTPDFKSLAVSGFSRGAVWELAKGARLFHVRGFRGAYFDDDGSLYADFPKLEPVARSIVHMNLVTRKTIAGPDMEDPSERQFGGFLVNISPAKKGGEYSENVKMEVKDIRSLSVVWSRNFPKERPAYWINAREGSVVLSWPTSSKAAKEEIKNDPALNQQLTEMKEKEGDYYLKILDVRTGKLLGQLLVETGKGSFRIVSAFASGDWVVVADSENRTLVYSLTTRQQKRRVFGSHPVVSAASGLLCVENGDAQLVIYDLGSSDNREQLQFSSPISFARFSLDGRRLLVLTADQQVYSFDVSRFISQKQQ